MDVILPIWVFVPVVAGFGLLFVPAALRPLHKTLALVISLLGCIAALALYRVGSATWEWAIPVEPFALDLLFVTTPLNRFILLFAMGFGLAVVLYSLRTAAADESPGLYYGSILMTLGGSAGILLSNHLLWLLLFWEVVTASFYLLIVSGGKGCRFAATKSFAMIGASDAAFLLGVALVWAQSGTFVMSQLRVETDSGVGIAAFLLLMTAAITKAGALPLHTWLPTCGEDCHASVMAILPAAVDKLLGIYLLVIAATQLFVLRPGPLSLILAVIGAATILAAVMVAMVQHNVKKLLSYHAISQVGYMILGIATLTPVGIAGGVFHMLNHAIYKCCLFLCGGAVEKQTGTAELDELGGLGNRMPWTFLACIIAALSISGIPPLNGFVSKWMVYQGVVAMGRDQTGAGAALWPAWLAAAMFGSALTLASFVKILHALFLSRRPSHLDHVREAPASMLAPMLVLAGLCVLFGVAYMMPLDLFIAPATGLSTAADSGDWLGLWDAPLATAFLLLGLVVAGGLLLVAMRSRTVRSVPTWSCGEVPPNDRMIVPGTHFYKTVSSLQPLRCLYRLQEKGWFDVYAYGGTVGQAISRFLRWMHSGVLNTYLTWVVVGLLVVLYVLCDIW
ncbi:MAG TPA: hypothetical protein ENN87_14965 [Phycisphaerales bacterium]|nr:hypothetical protein [Phycisphaerales bacterium]